MLWTNKAAQSRQTVHYMSQMSEELQHLCSHCHIMSLLGQASQKWGSLVQIASKRKHCAMTKAHALPEARHRLGHYLDLAMVDAREWRG